MGVNWSEMTPDTKRFYLNLSRQWGGRLPLTSGYRSPEYNASVGGAKHSRHMHGDALDIDISGMPEADRIRLIEMASQGGAGGIGIYDNSLHFDLAGKRAWGPSYGADSVPAWAQPAVGKHLAAGATATDAGPSREQWQAEMQRRQAQASGPSREEWQAEMMRRQQDGGKIATAVGGEGPPAAERIGVPQPKQPGALDAASRAATAMIADINAGFQGVNPVAVSQASPVGAVVRKGGKVYSDIDGSLTEITPEEFKNYVTQVDPDTGTEWLYKRTPELEDPGAASAGRVLGYGIIGGPGQAVRSAARAESATAPAMRTMQEKGITPSLGMTGGAGARVAGALEGNVVTSGPVVRDAQRAYGEVQKALGETAASVGPGTTAFEGGQALRDGANKFLVEHLKGSKTATSRSQMLFDKVDQAIPKGTMIDVGDLTGTLGKFVEKFKNAPNIGQSLGAGRWQKWLDDIAANGGKLTWVQTRALRTDIGEALGSLTGPVSDVSGGELKLLYGALTRDLDAAAAAVGPGALKAWKNANEHYKWASEKIQEAFDIMFKGDPHNEKAYANFLALGSADGPRANITKLADIKRAMPEEDWATVVATTIRRMGQATPGGQDAAGQVFSAGKFMTDWNKLSPAAKSILFSGKGVPHGLRAELDAMARVVELAKNAERQINYSRSGSTLGNLGVGALGGASIALGSTTTALIAAAVTHLGARAITSPAFLRATRNYIARGGTPALAEKLLKAAGDDRELLANANTIIRLAAPQSSQQPQLPQAPGRLGLPAP